MDSLGLTFKLFFFISIVTVFGEEKALRLSRVPLLDGRRVPGKNIFFLDNNLRTVTVLCEAPHQDSGLQWEKKEAPMKWTLKTSSSSLYLRDVTEKDSGEYKCSSIQHPAFTNVTIHIYVPSDKVTITGPGVIKEDEKEMMLSCELKDSEELEKPTWTFNGEAIDAEGGKYVIFDNGTLLVKRLGPMKSGFYQCEFETDGDDPPRYQNLLVHSPGYVHQKHSVSKNLMEGDNAVIDCDVYGFPTPVISWFRDGLNLTNDTKRIFYHPHKGIENASLEIQGLEFSDRAQYMCVATNSHGSHNATTLVRVKDKLAALWPFLGIVLEVIVLVTIIFLYERRRAKKEAEEEEEPNEQKKALTEETVDVRQRAVKT